MLAALFREVTITTIYNASLNFNTKAQMGQITQLALPQRQWQPCPPRLLQDVPSLLPPN